MVIHTGAQKSKGARAARATAHGVSGVSRFRSNDVFQFAPNFSVYVLPHEVVCLYSEDRKFFLHGELYVALAQAIGERGKGERQLVAELGAKFPVDQIEETIKRLIERRTAESQRLSKVLEDAGIKIDSVASRLLGKSGREMIEALIAGERNPGRLADLARGVLRRKTDDLQMACDGRFTGGHGQMCRLHLDAYDHLTAKIAELDALIAEAAAPFAAVIARLMTIPGIGQRTAEVIVAETGGDMTRFATSARLAAWAGLAPGDNQSAGKRKYAAARPGNRYLRAAMTESAWATARTRTRPGARFRRLARRFGKGHEKKAAIAVARTLICIAWAVMARGQDYADAGEDYYDQRDQRAGVSP